MLTQTIDKFIIYSNSYSTFIFHIKKRGTDVSYPNWGFGKPAKKIKRTSVHAYKLILYVYQYYLPTFFFIKIAKFQLEREVYQVQIFFIGQIRFIQ